MTGSGRTLTVVLSTAAEDPSTRAVLRLADAAVSRGHRVAVFAHGPATAVTSAGSASSGEVAALLRRGAPGGLATWVVASVDAPAAAGVIGGDGGDLWRLVRDGDVVVGVAG